MIVANYSTSYYIHGIVIFQKWQPRSV